MSSKSKEPYEFTYAAQADKGEPERKPGHTFEAATHLALAYLRPALAALKSNRLAREEFAYRLDALIQDIERESSSQVKP